MDEETGLKYQKISLAESLSGGSHVVPCRLGGSGPLN